MQVWYGRQVGGVREAAGRWWALARPSLRCEEAKEGGVKCLLTTWQLDSEESACWLGVQTCSVVQHNNLHLHLHSHLNTHLLGGQ